MSSRLLQVSAIVAALAVPAWSDEATEEEYKERLERYDLQAEPEKHRVIASWCKRNYPAKYSFHQREFNKHEFSEFEGELPDKPSSSDLKKAKELALKLELFDVAEAYHIKWGEMQYAIYAKRLEPGNVKMMKQLLAWAEKEKLTVIPSVKSLAQSIIEKEPGNLESRQILGHLQVEGSWTSKEDLIAIMDPKDIQDRIKTHKYLSEARKTQKIDYPSRPTAGMEEVGNYFKFQPKKSPESQFYLVASNYSKSKPGRLIISLHGGGSGGFKMASEQAGIAASAWSQAGTKESQVVLCPIATNHVVSSWSDLSNVLEILNAAEEVCELFNIDRKKIYVTGQSMGGGGTTFWYLCFPELAAASVARTGWFHHDSNKHQDCLQKPILLIQGDKDEAFRVESRGKFLEVAKKVNGNATLISHPDIGHDLYWKDQEEDVLNFMEKHVNDLEPDWDVIRVAAKAWLK